ncbi:MAG TPA: tryptophan halogenase family protein [Ideonella sp.]|uniref:tryptophan halogenase family protein n=1 Tax=Ideonella sp. TaxID=1929293 RepID=UPI002E318476|nr:tryptophan halogenase family protein [Ideonella sp.]HEX5688227.1 tryptophan halogenase family protein [Ideonella sp.]
MSDRSDHAIQRVVVVGGGSAGWLTAGLLAAEHGDRLKVVVLESPNVAPIGVGEGTWPTMRDSLRDIGVTEAALFRECDASFKQGSRFNRWATGQPDDRYFHPFVLPQGYTEANLVAAWLQQHPAVPFAELVSFQPHLCLQGRAPKQFATPEYAAVANYAYHFDAGKFGVFLRAHCIDKLGVQHVLDDLVGVNSHDNGDIASVQTQAHGDVAGDLFVDCTGMQSLLLGRHYGVGFVSHKHVLFCDAALALQVSYADEHAPIASQTISTAQGSGWVWDIGLQTRRGVGLVYSSAHMGDDEAQGALRDHIAGTGGPADLPPARKLCFEPGHRETFWHRNCLAIGLSAGFLEPLEASAIALIEYSAGFLRDQLPATREAVDIVARRFNEGHRYRWARIIDFLKLHYVLSQRRDTEFWRDNQRPESIPDSLREALGLWRHTPPSRYDLVRNDEAFPSASCQYVLYGMGFKPERFSSSGRDADKAAGYFQEAAQLTRKMLPALPGNRELIEHIKRHGLPRI